MMLPAPDSRSAGRQARVVSFVITAAILRFDRGRDGEEGLEQYAEKSRAMKAEGAVKAESSASPASIPAPGPSVAPSKIVFACDAGMGSSTMGASIFRKKLSERGRTDLDVVNTAIERVPSDADVVVVHENLAERTRAAHPGVELVTISNYLHDPALDGLLDTLTTDGKVPDRAD